MCLKYLTEYFYASIITIIATFSINCQLLFEITRLCFYMTSRVAPQHRKFLCWSRSNIFSSRVD